MQAVELYAMCEKKSCDSIVSGVYTQRQLREKLQDEGWETFLYDIPVHHCKKCVDLRNEGIRRRAEKRRAAKAK